MASVKCFFVMIFNGSVLHIWHCSLSQNNGTAIWHGLCLQVVQDHSQVRRLAMRSHKARHVGHSLLWFITAKGRGAWHRVWGSQAQAPCGVTQDARDSSSAELWQRVWSIVCQGSLLETRCPVFMGTSQSRAHPLPSTYQGPDSQRGSRYSSGTALFSQAV